MNDIEEQDLVGTFPANMAAELSLEEGENTQRLSLLDPNSGMDSANVSVTATEMTADFNDMANSTNKHNMQPQMGDSFGGLGA